MHSSVACCYEDDQIEVDNEQMMYPGVFRIECLVRIN